MNPSWSADQLATASTQITSCRQTLSICLFKKLQPTKKITGFTFFPIPYHRVHVPSCFFWSLLAEVFATSSSFEIAEYRACTSISIPTIQARMRRGLDGVRIVSGNVDGAFSLRIGTDDHPSHLLHHIHSTDSKVSRCRNSAQGDRLWRPGRLR